MRDIIVRDFVSRKGEFHHYAYADDGLGGLFTFAADDYIGYAMEHGYNPPFAVRVVGVTLEESDTDAIDIYSRIKDYAINNGADVIVIGNGWKEGDEEHYPLETVYVDVINMINASGYIDLLSYDAGCRTALGFELPSIESKTMKKTTLEMEEK